MLVRLEEDDRAAQENEVGMTEEAESLVTSSSSDSNQDQRSSFPKGGKAGQYGLRGRGE